MTRTETLDPATRASEGASSCLAVVIAWAAGEPHRVGEVALLPSSRVVGRGDREAGDPAPKAGFVQQRPGGMLPCPPLAGSALSRVQLLLTPARGRLRVVNLGRRQLTVDGVARDEAVVAPGAVLHVDRQLVLLVEERPQALSDAHLSAPAFPFGAADPSGMVGESPAAWALRARLHFVAPRPAHVLLTGPSGSGKELAAQAIHLGSPRRDRTLVSRNAATLPEGLVDAELFGNIRGYPHAQMQERPGLIGSADGSTLFLDELGELPAPMQAHLLRVLDAGGEYHRLGDSRSRRSDLRLVAATNRDPSELKHDLLARLELKVQLPGLGDRLSDVPLLVRAQLQSVARADPALQARFFDGDEPRLDADLIVALLRHRFELHVRELRALLWDSLAASAGDRLELGDALRGRLSLVSTGAPAELPGPEAIAAALTRNGGNQAATWRELGLRNRDVLYRLIKKHGIDVPR